MDAHQGMEVLSSTDVKKETSVLNETLHMLSYILYIMVPKKSTCRFKRFPNRGRFVDLTLPC